MKNLFVTLFLAIAPFINSQTGYVTYNYVEALAMGNLQGPQYNAYLTFDAKHSYYVTAKDSLQSSFALNETKQFKNEDPDAVGAIFNGLKSSPDGDQVFYANGSKKMNSTFKYLDYTAIDDGVQTIKWTIHSSDHKLIGSFNCTRATARFRGRDYTAWYSVDIAVPYGPWKLNGLPGLILEAYDTNKHLYWGVKDVKYPDTTVMVKLPKNGISYLPYPQFKEMQLLQIQKDSEKLMILNKQYPSIAATAPKLSEMYIECE